MTSTIWAEQYLGIPYAEGGMTHEGCNCWGLVRLVLAEQAGIAMPAYGDLPARQIGDVARGIIPADVVSDWVKIAPAEAEALDVVLMRGVERLHCGILVDRDRILHVETHTDAVVVPRDHYSVAPRVVGHYRHRSRLQVPA